jgi:hypothetical protein
VKTPAVRKPDATGDDSQDIAIGFAVDDTAPAGNVAAALAVLLLRLAQRRLAAEGGAT